MALPNIVFFFTDQQRWDTAGCYGQELNITQNLDQLAADGVRFENAFTCQPVCGPARACLQTGKYATQTGVYRNGIALRQGEKTIAHWLSEAGYEVGYLGKWHLASTIGNSNEEIGQPFDCRTKPVPPERRGGWKDFWLAADALEHTSHGYDGHLFDAQMQRVDFKGYRADCLTDFAIDFLKNRSREKPFFLFISYLEPHHQNDRNRFVGPHGSKEKFKDFQFPGDLKGKEGDWEENYPDYLGACSQLDYNLGRIIVALEELRYADNTVLFFTSDHGCHFQTRNREYKRSCHEASIRIPLVIHGPGFRGGKVVQELVSLIDLPPTILNCAGLTKPEYMQGRPLEELLAGAADWPEEVFVQISETQVGRAIRTKRWKYSVRAPEKDGNLDSRSSVYVEDCLYDLKADPHEQENLVSRPELKEVRKELAAILKGRMAAAGEETPVIEPADS